MRRDHHMRPKGELWFYQMPFRPSFSSTMTAGRRLRRSVGTKDPAQARLKRDVFLIQKRAEFERLRKVAAAANAQKAGSQLATERAIVAVCWKLSIILNSMWTEGKVFRSLLQDSVVVSAS